jgi:hypothetical protein
MNMDKVSFKSREPFFSKEADGRKPNTFRKDDPLDKRFAILAVWMQDKNYGLIEIVCAQDGGQCEGFTRQVTDVSFYEGWFIISWKHPEPLFDIKRKNGL